MSIEGNTAVTAITTTVPETTNEQIKRIQLENVLLEQQNLREELEAKAAERERRNLDIRKLKIELEK